MKRKIRTPYFEIGTKNYIYGDKVLEYALAADAAAEKYDIDVLFITPAVEIRRIVENFGGNIQVFDLENTFEIIITFFPLQKSS